MATSIAPPYLHGDRLRDWWGLWLDHADCEVDPPELLPHMCQIRALLLNDQAVLRWVRLRAEWPSREGLVVG